MDLISGIKMSKLVTIFQKLNKYFDCDLTWEHIEQLYENVQKNYEVDPTNSAKAEGTEATTLQQINKLPVIRRATINENVISTSLDLCTAIRTVLNEANGSYDNTLDCWEQLSHVMSLNGFLGFIYALAGLVHIEPTLPNYIKISLTAIDTYFLSLTIPGAKTFHIFQEDIIQHCLQVFGIVQCLYNWDFLAHFTRQQSVQIWIQFSTLCDDLRLLVRYVHFNVHLSTRDEILRRLVNIQFLNFDKGYANAYAADLHQKCFEIFEEMIKAHNGDVEETFLKIMKKSVILHAYAAKPRSQHANSTITNINSNCEHISDWFLQYIDKYPSILVKVLTFYIECIITNPIKGWKSEQLQRALDYAAKYDAQLYTKCNASCLELLRDAVYADEVMVRVRAVELIGKILQTQSEVDSQIFQHEVSDIPREVYFIKELIDSLRDFNNNVKLKAVQALHSTLTRGSPKAVLILTECIKFANFCGQSVNLPEEPRISEKEIRYKKPVLKTPEYTFKGYDILESCILNMPKYIFMHLYRNPLSYIRRAGIMLMEQLIKLNSLLIFNTNFVEESVTLANEPTALVRRETLLSLDGILKTYPNCYPVIWAWCKIITPLCLDSDPKNIDTAMECFRTTVLLNIKTVEESTKAEHFMPWLIMRTLLCTHSRLYLQNCFNMSLHQRQISPQVVTTIESYLLSSNSTEAWIMLNFLSRTVKSQEPDALIYHFTSLNSANSWNVMQNTLIAIEVLSNYVNDFSQTARNHAFNHILGQLKEGTMLPTVVGKAYDFLLLLDMIESMRNDSQVKIADKPWINELHKFLEDKILVEMTDFQQNHDALMSHLYTYTEVNVQTRTLPKQQIISFMQTFIIDYIKVKESDFNFENERLCNSMILLVGRLSIRDTGVARTSCKIYAQVLKVVDRPPVVSTILVVLTDLCKHHTHIVESLMQSVLDKLNSPFEVNRLQTFKCFEQLVLEDLFKLRGSLLINLLPILLDTSVALSRRADRFFAEYIAKKNPSLFHKCLKECPFILNEYRTFEVLDSYAKPHSKSPLKGETQLKRRHRLYEHFLKHLTDIKMISYFGQLEILADKSQDDPKLKSAEGIALIKDVLYILKRICQLIKEQKANEDDKEDDNMKDENLNELMQQSHHDVGSEVGPSKIVATSSTGGNRIKRDMTMTEAMTLLEKSLIFIPKIYRNVKAEGTELQESFDDLCMALTIRFSNLVEYAQPVEFWMKYKQIHQINIKKRSYPKTKNSNDKEDDSNNSSDSDDDCPLPIKKANIEDTPETMSDALYIEHLFKQNI